MSAATKRKHVTKEIISEFPPLPDPPQLFVARILTGRGNNLHLVEAALNREKNIENASSAVDSSLPQFLVSMPVKFRKNFWVKRGDFILCAPIDEGDKVKAEIVRVLYKDDVRYIRGQGRWPKEFENIDGENEKTDSDSDMFPKSSDEDEEEDEKEDADERSNGNSTNLSQSIKDSER
jgi:probable RNA-binding protein EIF1AD